MPANGPKTIIELLAWRAIRQPDQTAFSFLADVEEASTNITYADLDRKAKAIGYLLQSLEARGQRAVLLYPSGLGYIAGFLGCLYAGAVAVPVYPPRPNQSIERLQNIIEDSKATIGLTDERSLSRLAILFSRASHLKNLQWFATDILEDGIGLEWADPGITNDTLALLQYTSGSISKPKGVMITHGNLMYNEQIIQKVFRQSESSVIVSWLPLYHDMGLIGNVLQPMFLGARCVLMSPMAFLQRPFRWLQAISRYKATTSGAPNFAYDLCARKITPEQRERLDLSSWKVAYNGSEPVRAETLNLFSEVFEPCGFRRDAFHPCYGLAEATLLVSGVKSNIAAVRTFNIKALERNRVVEVKQAELGTGNKSAQPLVSCGRVPEGTKVVIVNPETFTKCLPDEIGEIWISGLSVAQGYFGSPVETAEVFRARLLDTDGGPYLRTGDLGFLRDEELFITGRLKDLIIIRGLNYYPQDIESIVERCHPACRIHSGAAFAIEVNGEEGIVVMQEVDLQHWLDLNNLIETIRQEIAKHFELQIHSVVLVKAGQLSRTSSGKIRRRACKQSFLAGNLVILASDTLRASATETEERSLTLNVLLEMEPKDRRTAIEAYLQEQVSKVLRISPALPNPHRPLVSLGIDSLMAAELKSSIELDLKVMVPVVDVLQANSISSLVTRVADQLITQPFLPSESLIRDEQVKHSASVTAIRAISRDNDLSLSFDQERLWILDQLGSSRSNYNITASLHVNGFLDVGTLKQCFAHILQRHEILRTVFRSSNSKPAPVILTGLDFVLSVIDLQALPESQRRQRSKEATAEIARSPFELARGPLLRAALLQLAQNEHILVLVTHHIISDYWSVVLIIREINTLYEAFSTSVAPSLDDLSIQYVDFAHWQRLQRESWESQLLYWKNRLAGVPPLLLGLIAKSEPNANPSHSEHCSFELPPHLLKALRELSRNTGSTLFMTLLAAFKVVLRHYSGKEDILVGAPATGRFHAELKNVFGFFAYPLMLRTDLSGDPTFRELMARVREAALGAYAHQEVPFAKVVEVVSHQRNAHYNPLLQVMFSLVRAPSSVGEGSGLRIQLSDIQSASMNLQLFLTFTEVADTLRGSLNYDTDFFSAEAIELFIKSYFEVLEKCVEGQEIRLSQFDLDDKLDFKKRVTSDSGQQQTIVVASTFTADPLEETLVFWMQELNALADIKFAPCNQVFQELLDPSSLFSQNQGGFNVVLVRLEDWLPRGINPQASFPSENNKKLEEDVRNFIFALKAAAERSVAPHFVCLCPASEMAVADQALTLLFSRLEQTIVSELSGISGVTIIKQSEVAALYPVSQRYDSSGDELARIPYTATFFTALGTIIARKIYALWRAPYKVIIMDCDQTLWKGYCGEDGAAGIEIDSYRKSFQEFMLAQHEAGMLICLCSKNNEEDVIEIFERHSEMILKRDHLVSWRINWKPKSENIRSLAEELQLSLNSFIFIDDDLIECEAVRASCPEVLTLHLPKEPNDIAIYLDHIWAFDRLRVTEEDRNRTALYRQNTQRELLRQGSLTFGSFLASLDLKVQFSKLAPQHFARVAELTYRTNQFNLTTVRRSENEIRRVYQSGDFECFVVEVSDRFGDYGLVGVMIIEAAVDAIRVETFLLSCRALSRAVEYRMLEKLGEIANELQLRYVDLLYIPTPKNAPALTFLNGLNVELKQPLNRGWLFRVLANLAAQTHSSPEAGQTWPIRLPTTSSDNTLGVDSVPTSGRAEASLLSRIAIELRDVERILKEIRTRKKTRRQADRKSDSPFIAPRTQTEKLIAGIWAELINHEQLGVYDNFFELGGHSLLAIQIVSRVRESFGLELPLMSIFETPTIADLAAIIDGMLIKQARAEEIDETLKELDALSDEEVKQLLAQEGVSIH
jgi:FkbH-like protein